MVPPYRVWSVAKPSPIFAVSLVICAQLSGACATADDVPARSDFATGAPADAGGGGEADTRPSPGAGSDAGLPPRPGSGADAGGQPSDAGSATETDAGDPESGQDAGSGSLDAGATPDSGGRADAGSPDALTSDAGDDAGSPFDPPDDPLDPPTSTSCNFDYGFAPVSSGISAPPAAPAPYALPRWDLPTARIAHAEPAPRGTWELVLPADEHKRVDTATLVMPDYWDEMPLFERAAEWDGRRCYEYAGRAQQLTEAQAYDLYVRMVEETLWHEVDETPGHRTVVGVRGAYPGTFRWHGNRANFFNDTLVLLWRDADGTPNVREFPVNTDTGAHDFGRDSSSSLRPNRYYPYVNGWHRSYNALRIDIDSYPVRDDANNNGHWDSERNGWLNGGEADYDRNGGAHNIHMGSVDAPLGSAPIDSWSAGCQVIPGNENWIEFIANAWTGLGDSVDYYLLDARDIAAETWSACATADGSPDCPFEIRSLPYTHSADTSRAGTLRYDQYNCSTANESGRELMYVVNVRTAGTLRASVSTTHPTADPDVHLLEGDAANACLARNHTALEWPVTPGRYVIIVDSWTNSSGTALEGTYTLTVSVE